MRIYAQSRRVSFTNYSAQLARSRSTRMSSVRRSIFPIFGICRSWRRRANLDQKFCSRATGRIRNHSKSGRVRLADSENTSQPKARVTPGRSAPGLIRGSVTTLLPGPEGGTKSARLRLPGHPTHLRAPKNNLQFLLDG